MKATVEYIRQKFDEFNQTMFGGTLPVLPIRLSDAKGFLGKISFEYEEDENGNQIETGFVLRINTRIDLEESVVEDTIIHEMIHYYIGYMQLEDTSDHGPVFQKMMSNINKKFGRHITISYKGSEKENEQMIDSRPKWHVIAIISTKDGRKGVKVLPRVIERVVTFNNDILKDTRISSVDLYMHNDPYFNRYPNSKSLRFNIVDETEFAPHLEGAKRLICENGKLREVR